MSCGSLPLIQEITFRFDIAPAEWKMFGDNDCGGQAAMNKASSVFVYFLLGRAFVAEVIQQLRMLSSPRRTLSKKHIASAWVLATVFSHFIAWQLLTSTMACLLTPYLYPWAVTSVVFGLNYLRQRKGGTVEKGTVTDELSNTQYPTPDNEGNAVIEEPPGESMLPSAAVTSTNTAKCKRKWAIRYRSGLFNVGHLSTSQAVDLTPSGSTVRPYGAPTKIKPNLLDGKVSFVKQPMVTRSGRIYGRPYELPKNTVSGTRSGTNFRTGSVCRQ